MKHKLLIFISIFILNTQYIQADSLPVLPELAVSSTEQTNIEEKEDISLWQQILSFFGFGDDNKITEQKAQITNEENSSALITKTETTENLNEQTLEEEFVVPSLDAIENKNTTTIEPEAIADNSPSPTITNTDSSAPEPEIIQDSKPELITENAPSKIEEDQKDVKSNQANSGDFAIDTKTPAYAKELNSEEQSSVFRNQLLENLRKPTNLPQIPNEELIAQSNITAQEQAISQEMSAQRQKFVDDEAKVLTLENDDIVLGLMTMDAKLELIDFSNYVQIFWQNYNKIKNEPKKREIEEFIKTYDENYNSEEYLYDKYEDKQELISACKAINNGKIYNLIALLNNYSIINFTDLNNNTLLHKAAYANDYSATKLLLMKGINLNAQNIDNQDALSIAQKYNNHQVAYLLKKAGAKH